MSKVTFIARKQVEAKDEEGNDVYRQKNWTRAELVAKVREASHELFSVPETHAQDVIIPQNKYQEVYDDIIEEGTKPAPKATGSSSAKS